jgi:hypothetical protein
VKPGAEVREAEVVPTTACLRCHDVRGPGKPPGVEPIPALAFDPFDKAGREAWLRATPANRRGPVLGRMFKRVAVNKDMPPVDAAEYELFRTANPAAFDEVRAFLEAELRKAR